MRNNVKKRIENSFKNYFLNIYNFQYYSSEYLKAGFRISFYKDDKLIDIELKVKRNETYKEAIKNLIENI